MREYIGDGTVRPSVGGCHGNNRSLTHTHLPSGSSVLSNGVHRWEEEQEEEAVPVTVERRRSNISIALHFSFPAKAQCRHVAIFKALCAWTLSHLFSFWGFFRGQSLSEAVALPAALLY